MIVDEHPTAEQLTDFGLGKLDDAEFTALEAHLVECETCRRALETQAADSFVALARAVRSQRTSADEGARAISLGAPTCALTASAVPAPTEVPPELANHPRYRILGIIGAGGMGAVFKAEHQLMHRVVALKVINRCLVANPAMVERFTREVIAAGNLSHPNIVHYHDAEHIGDTHFLVMEHVEGTNLAKLMAETGPLPIAQACDYIRQAALGLQHAFERGMVHRDIKPQNLMVTGVRSQESGIRSQESGWPVVKILDFGLARLAQETAPTPVAPGADTLAEQGKDTPSGTLTQIGTVMGTPDYIAPEQARDAHAADIRSDIYSLGCTLYDLLTGKPPFPHGTVMQKVIAHLEQTPRPLTELRPEVPAELARVVEKMLAKDPAQRYQTPAEVAEALTPFTKPASEPETLAKVAAKPSIVHASGSGRRRATYAVAGVFLIALLASFFISPVQDFAQTVIRIATNMGVLEFDADDANMMITIKRAGDQEAWATVVNKQTKRTFELKAGHGELTITELREDGEKRGMLVTKPFDLPRGGRLVFSAKELFDERNWAKPVVPVEANKLQPLFNVKDLDGWVGVGDAKAWQGRDGVLIGTGEPLGYVRTAKPYENYQLDLEYKLVSRAGDAGAPTAGILLHISNPQKIWPNAFEVQLGERTVALAAQGTTHTLFNNTISGRRDSAKPGEWNRVHITCKHHNIEVNVNDIHLGMAQEVQPRRGFIGLKVAGHEVHFRNIKIVEFPPSPPPPDEEQLQGTWRAVFANRHGLKVDLAKEEVAKLLNVSLTFSGDRVKLKRIDQSGKQALILPGMDGVFHLNPTKNPKEISVHSPDPAEGFFGIYQLEGDTLTVFYHTRKTKEVRYPKDFAEQGQPGTDLWVFKREPTSPPAPAFQPLFNGKDPEGWTGDTTDWQWKDGQLIGKPRELPDGRRLRSIWTTKPIKDFELTFQARLLEGEGNFAVRVRNQLVSVKKQEVLRGVLVEKKQEVLRGVLVEAGERGWGFLYLDEGLDGQRVLALKNFSEKLVNPSDFNDYAVRCVGNRLTVRVNGVVTVDKVVDETLSTEFKTSPLPASGLVGFQIRDGKEVAFRNIRIQELPDQSPRPAFQPLFNGKDLGGWDEHNGWPGDKKAWTWKDGNLIGEILGGSYLISKKSYRDFEMSFRVRGGSDDGIQCWLNVRSTAKGDQKFGRFAVGPCVPVDSKLGGFYTKANFGETFTPAKDEKELRLALVQWQGVAEVFVRCHGKRVTIRVNGVTTVDEEFANLPDEGVLAFHGLRVKGSRSAMVEFENLHILELPSPPPAPAFAPLFNGKDLGKWKSHPDQDGQWSVENDLLKCKGSLAHLFTERANYKNFHLRLDCKISAKGRAGISFGVPTMRFPKKNDFREGYRVWIDTADKEPGENVGMWFDDGNATFWTGRGLVEPERWFKLEIVAAGENLQIILDGKKILEETKRKYLAGHLALCVFRPTLGGQASTTVYFRNIEIKELPPAPPAPAFAPLFNGKNLEGWEGDTKTWAWKEGRLVGDTRNDRGPFRDCILSSRQRYRDFEMKFRVRVENLGGIYCGVALRNEIKGTGAAASLRGPDVAIGKNLGGFYTIGGIGKYLKPSKAALDKVIKVGFNDFHVRCVGKHVTITVNGVTTIDDDFPDIPDEGVLAFHVLRFPEPVNWQAVLFEDIQIHELKRTPAIPAPAFQPLFNGKDLGGWDEHNGWPSDKKAWT